MKTIYHKNGNVIVAIVMHVKAWLMSPAWRTSFWKMTASNKTCLSARKVLVNKYYPILISFYRHPRGSNTGVIERWILETVSCGWIMELFGSKSGSLNVFPLNFFNKFKIKIPPLDNVRITSLNMSLKGNQNRIKFRYENLACAATSQNLTLMQMMKQIAGITYNRFIHHIPTDRGDHHNIWLWVRDGYTQLPVAMKQSCYGGYWRALWTPSGGPKSP